MFRLQNNVPNVYVDFSRDFQLLCRLYDVVNASVREEVDSIGRLTNTKFIQSNALELLQTKLGFFTKKQFSDRELRFVLSAFPILLKNKGTKKGIEETVNIWVNLNHFNGNTAIGIDNQDHIVYIQFQNDFNLIYDFSILEEVLKYILPTGYFLDITVIAKVGIGNDILGALQESNIDDSVSLYTNIDIDTVNDEVEGMSLLSNSYVSPVPSYIKSMTFTTDVKPEFDYSFIIIDTGEYTLEYNGTNWIANTVAVTPLQNLGIMNETEFNINREEGDTMVVVINNNKSSRFAADTVRIESSREQNNNEI